MPTKGKQLEPKEQSARFREAAKRAGGDQKSFEKAFKRIVRQKSASKPK